ncbi:MAG: hypothetical protein IT495_03870 [Gammaproteobacteria bacterium]|nr:hypothetical protein [Gammaproteobacteria bacterium]
MNVGAVVEAARRFVTNYARLVGPFLAAHRAALVTVTLLAALGALAQGAVVGFLVFAVHTVEGGGSVGVAWLDAFASNRLLAAPVLAAAMAAMLLAGAWATLSASRRTRALGRAFHQSCVRDGIIALDGSSSLAGASLPENPTLLRRTILLGSNQLGNALEDIVRMIEPVFRCLIALFILLWISAPLTLVVLPLLAVFVPIVYRASSRATQDAERFFHAASMELFARVGATIDAVNASNVGREPGFERELERFLDDESGGRNYFDSLDRMRLSHATAHFGVSLATSGLLVFVMLAVLYLAGAQRISWGLVLGYLLSLAHLLQSGRTLQSYVTSLSIFYSSARKQLALRDNAVPAQAAGDDDAVRDAGDTLVLTSAQRWPGGSPALTVQRGDPVLVLAEPPLDRTGLRALIVPLAGASSAPLAFWRRNVCFVGARARPAEWALGTPGAIQARVRALESAAVADIAARAGLQAKLATLRLRLARDPVAAQWDRVDRDLRAVLLLAPVAADERAIVLVDLAVLPAATSAARTPLVATFAGRFVFFVTRTVPLANGSGGCIVAVMDGEIAGIGSREWLAGVCPDLLATGRAGSDDSALQEQELLG